MYAGQKCSAASRVLAHEKVADALLERLAGAVKVLLVGQADDFATDVPPVIEREAQQRVNRYAELAAQRGARGGARRRRSLRNGWFCAPTLVADLPPDSAVIRDEIFGPLLAVERVQEHRGGLRGARALAVRAHRRPLLPQSATPWTRWRAARRWATST